MSFLATNPKALSNYQVLEKKEAGIVLTGIEIKSLRSGRVSLSDSFVRIKEGEAFLYNCYIAPFQGGILGYDPVRPRKLLLKKNEIANLAQGLGKNLTIVPLRVYTKNNYAKVEIALVRGKRRFEKHKEEKKRAVEREIAQAIKPRG